MTRTLAQANVSRDDCLENVAGEVAANVFGYLGRELAPAIIHTKDYAFELEVVIARGLDPFHGVQNRGEALEGVVLALKWDQQRIGGHQGIKSEEAQGRWTIQQNIIESVLNSRQSVLQALDSVLHLNQFKFPAHQIPVSGQKGQRRQFRCTERFRRKTIPEHDVIDATIEGPGVKPETCRAIALCVHIHDQGPLRSSS